MKHSITAFAVSLIASNLLIIALIPALHKFFPDKPNARSSHIYTTPRGGGIVFVLIAIVASCLNVYIETQEQSVAAIIIFAPLIAIPLALTGLIDDRYNLSVTWRSCIQIITSIVLILGSPLIKSSSGFIYILIFSLIAVTGVINFTNFMDGLDGLVAGCMGVAITAGAIQLRAPWPIWSLIGALLGFLIWNWSPAKVFMGDVGSTFLGAIFSCYILQASTWSEAIGILMTTTPLYGDALICVLRRLKKRQMIFKPHRLHLYQRLNQAGWTHESVSMMYISASAAIAFALLLGNLYWVVSASIIVVIIGFWLDQRVAIPFNVALKR